MPNLNCLAVCKSVSLVIRLLLFNSIVPSILFVNLSAAEVMVPFTTDLTSLRRSKRFWSCFILTARRENTLTVGAVT